MAAVGHLNEPFDSAKIFLGSLISGVREIDSRPCLKQVVSGHSILNLPIAALLCRQIFAVLGIRHPYSFQDKLLESDNRLRVDL